MKRLVVAAAVLALLSGAFAQEIKVFGGADWAWYKAPGALQRIPDVIYTFQAPCGLLFGLGIEFPLAPILSADLGLQYFQKGSKDEIFDPLTIPGFFRETFRLDVISLPACLKIKPFPKFPVYVLAGGEVSYVLDHDRTVLNDTPQPVRHDVTGETRRLDIGLVVGGGAEIRAASRWAVFAEVRYYIGLVNLEKPGVIFFDSFGVYYPDLKTRALALQVGVSYSLSAENR